MFYSEDDQPQHSSKVRFFPHSLDSPIRKLEIDIMECALLNLPRPQSISPHVRFQSVQTIYSLLPRSTRNKKLSRADSIHLIEYFSSKIDKIPQILYRKAATPYNHNIKNPMSACGSVLTSTNDAFSAEAGGKCVNPSDILQESRLLLRYRHLFSSFNNLLSRRRLESEHGYSEPINTIIEGYGASIWLSDEYCFIETESSLFFGGKSIFLNLIDCFRIRETALDLNRFIRKVPESKMESLWKWADKINSFDNEFYTVTKGIESLTKCWMSHLSDGDLVGGPNSFMRMMAKLEERANKIISEKKIAISMTGGEMLNEISVLLSTCTLTETVELFGLQKSIGYPYVDTLGCGESVRSAASGGGAGFMVAFAENEWLFCHLVLKNMIKRTGSWPLLTFDRQDIRLHDFYKEQLPSLDDGSYDLSEWHYVKFTKAYTFDPHEDYLEFMQDKACTPPFQVLKDKYEGKKTDPADFRLIPAILKKQKFDSVIELQSYLDYVDDPKPPRDVVRIVEKEKEYKPNARGFGILPVGRRMALGIIQENVKKGVYTDLPYQTMTLSRTAQQFALWEGVSIVISGGLVFIEIDFSKWNNKFRGPWIRRIGRRLDQLYGVSGIFGRIHDYFERSLIVMWAPGSRITALEYSEEDMNQTSFDDATSWTTHRGGVEGLAQAEWTAATIPMVYQACEGLDAEFTLIGQGDNQCLRIHFDDLGPHDLAELSDRTRTIMNRIDMIAWTLDHDAKPDEFVESRSTFTYSKQIFVNGEEIPTNLKYGSQISPLSNSEIPSIGDSIGSLYSSCSTASERSDTPLAYWCFALHKAENYITRSLVSNPFTGGNAVSVALKSMSVKDVRYSLIIPSICGGFPIVPWTSFMLRGDPDPLGSTIAYLRRLAMVDHSFASFFQFLLVDSNWRTDLDPSNLSALIEDPTSIPLKKTAGSKALIKDYAREIVQAQTKNEDFREVFGRSKNLEIIVKKNIMTLRPFFPYLAHELYKSSLPGIADQLEQRYTLTRTLVTQTRSQGSINGEIVGKELRGLFGTLSIIGNMSRAPCQTSAIPKSTYEFCNLLRDKWPGLIGEEMGISTAHFLDFELSPDRFRHGIKLVTSADASILNRGPYLPFLGSVTQERKTEKMFDVKPTRGIETLKSMCKAWTSIKADPEVSTLINSVLATRSSVSLEDVLPYLPKIQGGSVAHRYAGGDRGMYCGPIGSMNLNSHVRFLTDDIPGISGSKVDRPIVFQQFFSALLSWARLRLLNSVKVEVLVYVVNSTLIPELKDFTSTLTSPIIPIPPCPISSPFLRIDPIRLAEIERDIFYAGFKLISFDAGNTNHISQALKSIFFNSMCGIQGSSIDTMISLSGGVTQTPIIGVTEFNCIPRKLSYKAALDACVLLAADIVVRDRHTKLNASMRVEEASRIVSGKLVSLMSPVLQSATCTLGPWTTKRKIGSKNDCSLDMELKTNEIAQEIYVTLTCLDHCLNFPLPAIPFSRGGLLAPSASLIRCISVSILALAQEYVNHQGLLNGSYVTPKPVLTQAKAMYISLHNLFHVAQRSKVSLKQLFNSIELLFKDLLSLEDCAEDFRGQIMLNGLRGVISDCFAWQETPSELVRAMRAINDSVDKEDDHEIAIIEPGSVHFGKWKTRATNTIPLWPEKDTNIISEQYLAKTRFVSQAARLDRIFGLHTSIISIWYPIAAEIQRTVQDDERVLVVGTGAGSIQCALALAGVTSTGVDLISTIAIDTLSGPSPSPPESEALGLKKWATYDIPLLKLGGDAFSSAAVEEVIGRNDLKKIIIDIEQGTTNPLKKIIQLVIDWSTSGRTFFVKLFCNNLEARDIYERFSRCAGVHQVQAVKMSPCVHDDHDSSILFRIKCSFRIAPRQTIQGVETPLDFGSIEPAIIWWKDNRPLMTVLLSKYAPNIFLLQPVHKHTYEQIQDQVALGEKLIHLARLSNRNRQMAKLISLQEKKKDLAKLIVWCLQCDLQPVEFLVELENKIADLEAEEIAFSKLPSKEQTLKKKYRIANRLTFLKKGASAIYSLNWDKTEIPTCLTRDKLLSLRAELLEGYQSDLKWDFQDAPPISEQDRLIIYR